MAETLFSESQPWAGGVLKEGVHDRLVSDIWRVAERAGLGRANARYIWETTKGVLDHPYEEGYIKNFFKLSGLGKFGMCYFDANQKGAITRGIPETFMAMAGYFIRQYVDARVFQMGTILDYAASNQPVEATVLLIPDFFISKLHKQSNPARVQMIQNAIMSRLYAGQQTVLYADNLGHLADAYGSNMAKMIDDSYLKTPVRP